MIKLIVTDMDGTLLNSKGEINLEFWDIERKLSENGVIFAIASGRPYYNLVENFKSIKDNLLFITENGACVMYKDKEIYLNTMKKEDLHFLIEICKSLKGAVPVLCGKKAGYVPKDMYCSDKYDFKNEITKYYNKLEIVDDLTTIDDDIFKIAICDFEVSEKNSYNHFKHLEDRFQVVISGNLWLDLGKLDTTKGKAVEMSQKSLGITYDETMIFGDYLNDYSMMTSGKYSYAMKNAHPQLKKISNFVTEKDNNENGVLETVKEYFKDIL